MASAKQLADVVAVEASEEERVADEPDELEAVELVEDVEAVKEEPPDEPVASRVEELVADDVELLAVVTAEEVLPDVETVVFDGVPADEPLETGVELRMEVPDVKAVEPLVGGKLLMEEELIELLGATWDVEEDKLIVEVRLVDVLEVSEDGEELDDELLVVVVLERPVTKPEIEVELDDRVLVVVVLEMPVMEPGVDEKLVDVGTTVRSKHEQALRTLGLAYALTYEGSTTGTPIGKVRKLGQKMRASEVKASRARSTSSS